MFKVSLNSVDIVSAVLRPFVLIPLLGFIGTAFFALALRTWQVEVLCRGFAFGVLCAAFVLSVIGTRWRFAWTMLACMLAAMIAGLFGTLHGLSLSESGLFGGGSALLVLVLIHLARHGYIHF